MTTDLSKFSVAEAVARDADTLRKSVLDEVRTAIGGAGKVPPEDVGWTACTPAAAQARMVNGWVELRGTVPITKTSAYVPTVLTLPAAVRPAAYEGSYPVCCREVGVAPRMGYVAIAEGGRTVSFNPIGGAINEITVTGVRFQAGY